MHQILIGGDRDQEPRLRSWLAAWGLPAGRLPDDLHPAQVPVERACAVIFACGSRQPLPPLRDHRPRPAAPLLLLGGVAPPDLRASAWLRIADPGPQGASLAAALRPCLEASTGAAAGTGFQDLLNHELRTPLTAAGTALQTLAMQLARAGGSHADLLDVALRNIRRLERTVDWACDYMTEGTGEGTIPSEEAAVALVDLLEDLDDLTGDQPVTWSTAAGDWESVVCLDRESWRRLWRQMLRAISLLAPLQPVHLDLSLLSACGQAAPQPSGLLAVVNLPRSAAPTLEAEDREHEDAEQLRRLLAFTINPALARRLDLRLDTMRLADRLRLRLMLPLTAVASGCLA